MSSTVRPWPLLVAMLGIACVAASAHAALKIPAATAAPPSAAPHPAAPSSEAASKAPGSEVPTKPSAGSGAAPKPAPAPAAVSGSLAITVQVIASVPTNYVNFLGPAQPNPVSWATIIRYSVSKGSNVSVKLYSITGQEAATLVDGYQNPGNYSIYWDGTGNQGRLAPGVYIYRMSAAGFVKARRMVLLR
ncbi:MAG: FlgD immunoglobulin-like domain containing protein [Candidatus Eiseniibacteriota bacterium]